MPKPNRKKLRIAVAGAGTAGLAAAIFLSRAGHGVEIFESIDKAEPVGAGLLIQPTGQGILAELGVLEDLKLRGAPVQDLAGFRSSLQVLQLKYADLAPSLYGLGLHRANLQAALMRQALADRVKIHFKSAVSDFTQSAEEVCVRAGQKEVSFDLFIAASGSRSDLRHKSGIPNKHRAYPWGAFWLICESEDWPHRATLIQKYGEPWRTAGVLPTGLHPVSSRTCYSIFWSIHRSEFSAYRDRGRELLEERLQKFWPQACFLRNSRHSNWSVAEYADTRMRRFAEGRVVALGDVAHSMSPQLGQGANLALMDAKVLADSMASAADVPTALGHYSNLRRTHINFYRLASRALTPLYQSRLPLGLIRDAGTFLFGKAGPLYRQMLLMLAGYKGLSSKYRYKGE